MTAKILANFKMAAKIRKIVFLSEVLHDLGVVLSTLWVQNFSISYGFQDEELSSFQPKFMLEGKIRKILNFSEAIKI